MKSKGLSRVFSNTTAWLVFYNCHFHSACPLVERIKGLWKLLDGRDCLWRNLGLALVDGAMLSKFLIQFSADGLGCAPSLYFGLRGPVLGAPVSIVGYRFYRMTSWWLRWKSVCLQCRKPGWIPRLGRSPGEGNGNPLQYSCLENSMD